MSSTSELDLLLQRADRQHIADLARAAASVGLHDEQSRFASALIRRVDTLASGALTPEERALVRDAWKAEILPRSAACATLAARPDLADPLQASWRAEREQDFARRAEAWLSLVEGALIPSAPSDPEAEVEYLTWVGDLKSMLAERLPDAGLDQDAVRAYEQALTLAVGRLLPTHPIRLGLVLNYALCLYEHLKDQKKAAELAKRAFDEAVARLDRLDDDAREAATALLQLLRDRQAAWTAEAT